MTITKTLTVGYTPEMARRQLRISILVGVAVLVGAFAFGAGAPPQHEAAQVSDGSGFSGRLIGSLL
jgi:hypothetical protein